MTLNFDWKQTPTSITITFNSLIRLDAKKIDYVVTENYLKLNITEIKLFKFIDLYSEVDWELAECILQDFQIIFYLKKITEGIWPELEFKAKKDELKIRRETALNKFEVKKKEKEDLSVSRKKEFERFVLDKSIKMNEEQRNELKSKKNLEKNEAVNEVYKFFENEERKGETKDERGNNQGNIKQLAPDNANSNTQVKQIGNTDIDKKYNTNTDKSLMGIEDKSKNMFIVNNKLRKDENSIFNEEDLDIQENSHTNTDTTTNSNSNISTNTNKVNPKDYIRNDRDSNIVRVNNFREVKEPEFQMEVRKTTNIKVNLTEKPVAHFATRESLAKEPPYPKSKKFEPVKNYVSIIIYNF